MSPLHTWLLLGALVTCFITVMVLLTLDDEPSYHEAEDRDWLHEEDES